jgi:hypothetical protein
VGRNLFHITEPSYGVADKPGTIYESILALCCAPDGQVLMATSQSEQAEQGAVLFAVRSFPGIEIVLGTSPLLTTFREHTDGRIAAKRYYVIVITREGVVTCHNAPEGGQVLG